MYKSHNRTEIDTQCKLHVSQGKHDFQRARARHRVQLRKSSSWSSLNMRRVSEGLNYIIIQLGEQVSRWQMQASFGDARTTWNE